MRQQGTGEYSPAEGVEAETQPGSRGRVLRNLRGIMRKQQMDQAEFEALLQAQERYLHQLTPKTRFTAKLLCQMHRDWLGEIYAWAGQYRTVEMSKGGFQWPPAFRVAPNMEDFEKGLLRQCTPCRPASLIEVAGRIAQVHSQLLLIHPFRDGNGRLARWLADLMAQQAGFPPPDYPFTGRNAQKNRMRYLIAVQGAYLQNYDALSDFFREAIERGGTSSA